MHKSDEEPSVHSFNRFTTSLIPPPPRRPTHPNPPQHQVEAGFSFTPPPTHTHTHKPTTHPKPSRTPSTQHNTTQWQVEAGFPRIHGFVYDVGEGLLRKLDIDFKAEIKKCVFYVCGVVELGGWGCCSCGR